MWIRLPMKPAFFIVALSLVIANCLSARSETINFTTREISLGLSLEKAINSQRMREGKSALQSLTVDLNKAQLIYSEHILSGLLKSDDCDHDYKVFRALQQLIETSPKSIAVAIPTSEVIGCPSSTRGWSPELMVRLWTQSPQHNQILFEEAGRSNIGCQVKQRRGQTAALCTLWVPNS